MMVGIAMLVIAMSSVNAAWTVAALSGDLENGPCNNYHSGTNSMSLCEDHILEGGTADALAEAQGKSSKYHDKEEATFYYGWPYTVGAYARAESTWAYASVYRY